MDNRKLEEDPADGKATGKSKRMNQNHPSHDSSISRRCSRRRIRAGIVVVAHSVVLLLLLESTSRSTSADAFAALEAPPGSSLTFARRRRRHDADHLSHEAVPPRYLSCLRAQQEGSSRVEGQLRGATERDDPDRPRQHRRHRRPHNRRQQESPPDRSSRRDQHHDYQHHHRTSKERRNDSLRSGHHPLLSLNLNLDALASSSTASDGSGDGELAQELYQRISALYQEGYYAVPPDIVSFNSVLKAWRDHPERALQFWEQEMVPRVEDDERDYYYNEKESNMDRGGPESMLGATSQLPQGQNWRDRRHGNRRTPLLEPNVRSYNTFLWALARAGMYQQAEMLLDSMRHDQSLVLPDRITYNTVLLAYCNARCDDTTSSQDEDLDLLPDRSLKVLDEMLASTYLKPDAVTFNTIISIWSTMGTPAAALKAQELLELMSSLGIRPDVYTYTAVLQAWASVRERSDSISDNTPSAAQKALSILDEMKNADIQPNVVTYTIVMQALCRNNQPQAATELLQEVIEQSSVRQSSSPHGEASDVRPDAVMFSALMDGWARWMKGNSKAATPEQHKAASSEGVRAVLDLLSQMKTLSQTWPDVAPNERTYTSVLAALARSRHYSSGLRAERMLEDMSQRGIVPTTVHWNAVLDAYAKSPRSDKVREARRVWSKMVSRAAVEPDLVTYHTLLSAAASTRSNVDEATRRDCVRTGLQTFALLQRDPHVRPASLSFHYLFKILGRFLPSTTDHRRSVVQDAVRLCCASGCLNDALLRQLREHVISPEEEQQMMDDLVPEWRPNLSVADLPPSWSGRRP